MKNIKQILLMALCVSFFTTSYAGNGNEEKSSDIDPKVTKVERKAEIVIAGKYRGRQHNGANGIKVRCRGSQNTCYTITAIGDQERLEFPNGDIIMHTPFMVGGSLADGGIEIDPQTGEYVNIKVELYDVNYPPTIWTIASGLWLPYGIEDFWIFE
jgi:hypothetical protein